VGPGRQARHGDGVVGPLERAGGVDDDGGPVDGSPDRRRVVQPAGEEVGPDPVSEVGPCPGVAAGHPDPTPGVTHQGLGDPAAEHPVAAEDSHRFHARPH
jgi:hypothetical protein